jgi:hypothetical protein
VAVEAEGKFQVREEIRFLVDPDNPGLDPGKQRVEVFLQGGVRTVAEMVRH